MSNHDIEIALLSTFNDAGFARSLRAIEQLSREIGRINGQFARATTGKGTSFSSQITANVNALKKMNTQAATTAKTTTTVTKAVAKVATDYAAMSKAATAANSKIASSEKDRAAAQREYQKLIAKGTATEREKADAANLVTRANTKQISGLKELNTLQKLIARSTASTNKEKIAQASIQDTINRGLKAGQLLSGRISQTKGLKTDLADSIKDTRKNTVEAAKLAQQQTAAATKSANAQTRLAAQTARAQTQAAAQAARATAQGAAQAARAMQQAARQAAQLAQAFHKAYSAAITFANAMAKNIVKAATSAITAMGRLSSTASSRFASLQSSLASTGKSALSFGRNVSTGMSTASRSIERTAAGWSLLMAGSTLRSAGMNLLKGGGVNIGDYLEYEKATARAAIATQAPGQTNQGAFDLVQQLVFGIQRGSVGGKSVGNPVYNLSGTDIAQGAYYYGSALGQPFTQQNLPDIASSLSPMLQLSAFTGTSPETTIKGVLNAAQEFGVDPRETDAQGNLKNAGFLKRTTEMYGYLANVSSMEVPDIIEFFKMVGPMAKLAIGGDAEEALKQVMGFSFLNSEYGLRGSKVGSGFSRMLSSLYDPTDKMQGTAQSLWGHSIEEEFFNKDKTLKGGVMGLVKPFLDMSQGDWLQASAELFTENATRSIIPLIEGIRQDPTKYDKLVSDLGSSDVGDLLNNATLMNAQTLSGNLQNLTNMWNQFVAAVVGSIKGPAIAALKTFSNVIVEMADVISNNPFLGQFFAALAAGIGTVLTLLGTFLTLAGTLLILQRAFLFTHGSGSLFLSMFASIPQALLIGIPLIIALGAALVLLKRAWDTNTLGIQDLYAQLRSGDLSSTLQPYINTLHYFALAASTVFAAFVNKKFDNFQISGGLLDALKAFADGFKIGFVGVIAGIAKGIAAVVTQLKRAGEAGRWLGEHIEQWSHLNLAVNGVASTIGIAFGGILAGKIFTMLGPVSSLISLFQTLAVTSLQIGLRIAQAGVQILIFGAQVLTAVAAGIAWLAIESVTAAAFLIRIGLMTAASAATANMTVLSYALAAAELVLGASILSTVLGLFIFIGAAILVTAVIAGFIAAALAVVVITQGWAAAWADLVQVMQGVWTILSVVLQTCFALIVSLATMVAAIFAILGLTNQWYAAGILLGIALSAIALGVTALIIEITAGLIGALVGVIAATLGWVAALILANLPIILIVGGILLVGEALSRLLGFDGVFDMLGQGFQWVANAAVGTVKAVSNLVDEVLHLNATSSNAIAREMSASRNRGWDVGMTAEDKYSAADSYWTKKYGISLQQQTINDAGQIDPSTGLYWSEIHGTQAETGARQAYNDQWNLANGGYTTVATQRGKPMTMDPVQYAQYQANQDLIESNKNKSSTPDSGMGTLEKFVYNITGGMNFKDIQDKARTQKDLMTALLSGDTSKLTSMGGSSLNTQSTWDQIMAQSGGMLPKSVVADYNLRKGNAGLASTVAFGNGQPAGIVMPNFGGEAAVADGEEQLDDVETAAGKLAELVAATNDFNTQAQEALKTGMDLPSALAYKFDIGKATHTNQYMGIATALASNADAITANIPEEAKWSNISEGIMDTIGYGGANLTGNMFGKNMHTTLKNSTGFNNWAAEMGVSVDDMLKDVPRFVHAEEFVPLAFADIAKTVQEGIFNNPNVKGKDAQTAMYKSLDSLGADLGGNGLDWNELAQFAVSETQAGESWNLASYISERWDMSIAEANAYIKDHGLDPNVINDAAFPDLKMNIDSMGGKVNLLSPEQYQWLLDQTQNLSSQIITITQSAFDAMPDSMKFTLSNMGYTFVVNPDDIAEAAFKFNDDIQAAVDAYNSSRTVTFTLNTDVKSKDTTHPWLDPYVPPANAGQYGSTGSSNQTVGIGPLPGSAAMSTVDIGPLANAVITPTVDLNTIRFDVKMATAGLKVSILNLTTAMPKADIDSTQFNSSYSLIVQALNAIPSTKTIYINMVTSGSLPTGNVAAGGGPIAGLASGGTVGAGLTWVGERGPELMVGGQGNYIHSASESQRLMRSIISSGAAGGGSDSTTVNFHGDNHFRSEADIERLAERVQYMIGKKNQLANRGMTPTDQSRVFE